MIQLATTIEQSQHLLDLGLSADTADMCFDKGTDLTKAHLECDNFITYFTNDEYPEVADRYVPAWSLGALLELMPPYLFEWERGIDLNIYRNLNGKGWHCSYMPNNINDMQKDKFRQITNGDTTLEATYNMVVWLLENGYIKKL
jgi:hypothetical protein